MPEIYKNQQVDFILMVSWLSIAKWSPMDEFMRVCVQHLPERFCLGTVITLSKRVLPYSKSHGY